MDVRCEWIFHEASIVVVPSSFSFCINAYPPTRFSGEAARRVSLASLHDPRDTRGETARGASVCTLRGSRLGLVRVRTKSTSSKRREYPSSLPQPFSIPRLTYNYIIIIILSIINYYNYYYDDCHRAIEGVFYRETREGGEKEREKKENLREVKPRFKVRSNRRSHNAHKRVITLK